MGIVFIKLNGSLSDHVFIQKFDSLRGYVFIELYDLITYIIYLIICQQYFIKNLL